jgi:hypothetical protein
MWHKLVRVLPHVDIILSLLLLTLLILDKFNPGMQFGEGVFFKVLVIILCLTALTSAGILIAHDRRRH